MTMLAVENLHVHYGAIHALKGVSLTVNEGQIVTLIGANGAGKTTTLRALSGLITPSRGTVHLRNEPITGMRADRIVKLGVSHVPEGRGVFPNLTVEENLQIGAFTRNDRDGITHDFDEVVTLFPRLRERWTQLAGTLSGGEQQMLAIARAMMARPRVLLLDEPSLGLAPQVVMTIFQIIRDLNQRGVTILLIEQNAHMALHVAHYAYVLETGSIVMHGDARELAKSDAVRKAYLGGH